VGHASEDTRYGWSYSQKKQMGSNSQWLNSWCSWYFNEWDDYSFKIFSGQGIIWRRNTNTRQMVTANSYENDGRDTNSWSEQIWSHTKCSYCHKMGLKTWTDSSRSRIYADSNSRV